MDERIVSICLLVLFQRQLFWGAQIIMCQIKVTYMLSGADYLVQTTDTDRTCDTDGMNDTHRYSNNTERVSSFRYLSWAQITNCSNRCLGCSATLLHSDRYLGLKSQTNCSSQCIGSSATDHQLLVASQCCSIMNMKYSHFSNRYH